MDRVLPAVPAATRPRPARRYGDALAALASVQKPGAGFPAYTRWVNRRLARYAAAAAYRAGLSPNQVTAASAAVSVVAIVLVATAPATPVVAVLAAVLFAAGYLLDSADGQVARLSGTGSSAGEWLDHVVDAIRTPAVHLAVFAGLLAQPSVAWWLRDVALLFCVVAVGQFTSQILAEQLSGRVHRPVSGGGVAKSWLTLPNDTGVLCWLFLLWAAPQWFAAAYAVLFLLNTVHMAASMRRKYQHLTQREDQS
ncbi:MAG TPA: CDP-alcohol phosphatidyltransferase family protein [Amnibacterium sp.]|nr:CDP-alcohol phosphatidyltransferase family protein [Amnibacterium sp.]